MAGYARSLNPLNNTFGLPPSTWISDDMIINSMPVFEIIPCTPNLARGLNLFRVIPAEKEYLKILKNHGFTTNTPLRFAFLADNFPTDTFTNEYGETFLQKFTDVASQGMSQMIQMTGTENTPDAMTAMGEFTADVGEGFGKDSTLGKLLQSGGTGMQNIGTSLSNYQKHLESKKGSAGAIGGGLGLIGRMMAGHRVDFPQIWRNSAFSPSYTATIRLYNPNPKSYESTQKHIVGPLAVLLCLSLPRSEDGQTYNWPFFHKIKSPGIYNLDPAVITNLTVIKGGDQQQIAYNQRLGIVDVRLDFSSLYNSILTETGDKTFSNRPTTRSYLDSLTQVGNNISTGRGEMRNNVARLAGSHALDQVKYVSQKTRTIITRNEAVKQRQAPTVSQISASTRVPTTTVNKENILIAKNPGIYERGVT